MMRSTKHGKVRHLLLVLVSKISVSTGYGEILYIEHFKNTTRLATVDNKSSQSIITNHQLKPLPIVFFDSSQPWENFEIWLKPHDAQQQKKILN